MLTVPSTRALINACLNIQWRVLAIASAWIAGWVVYMIAMVLTVYDGALSLLFQPFMAAAWSTIFVAIVALIGLLTHIPVVARVWHRSWLWAAGFVCSSLLGIFAIPTTTYSIPEDGTITVVEPRLAMICYFLLLFGIANWPKPKRWPRFDRV